MSVGLRSLSSFCKYSVQAVYPNYELLRANQRCALNRENHQSSIEQSLLQAQKAKPINHIRNPNQPNDFTLPEKAFNFTHPLIATLVPTQKVNLIHKSIKLHNLVTPSNYHILNRISSTLNQRKQSKQLALDPNTNQIHSPIQLSVP